MTSYHFTLVITSMFTKSSSSLPSYSFINGSPKSKSSLGHSDEIWDDEISHVSNQLLWQLKINKLKQLWWDLTTIVHKEAKIIHVFPHGFWGAGRSGVTLHQSGTSHDALLTGPPSGSAVDPPPVKECMMLMWEATEALWDIGRTGRTGQLLHFLAYFCSSCGVLKVSYTLAANSFTWSFINKSWNQREQEKTSVQICSVFLLSWWWID